MKKRSYVFIILLFFFFLIIATFLSFLYFSFAKPPSVKENSYLELNLSGKIQEITQPDFLQFFISGTKALSMHDIWMNFHKAKKDSRIKGIVINLGYLVCDWGKINEIRESILDFRKSGKKVYAYIGEALDFDKEYFLATACDQIVLHPLGWLGINGIGGNIPFFKKTLDKLGIEAEFEHVEEYKTAYNMFTEKGFTPAHEEMMKSLYGNIYATYVNTIAESRNKAETEIKSLIDHGFFQGEKALEAGLVDKVLYKDQFEDLIKEESDKTSKITHENYKEVRYSASGFHKGEQIALIYAMGPIHCGENSYQTIGSSTYSTIIKKARKDKSIKAIILRVNSPGGSAMASDVIWRQMILAKKDKPVIVSMSDMAGSGGYWISMCAHKIVAHPQTLTGSIGVLSGKFNLEKLYQKIGVTSEKVIYGKRADIFSSFRGFTNEEKNLIKNEILWIYDRFITKVAESRNMTKDNVDKIGKGRVWTGAQAKKIGLIDETGGLLTAIKLAKQQADIPEKESIQLVVWPKKVSFLQTLLGKGQTLLSGKTNSKIEKTIRVFKLLEQNRMWALMPLGIISQ